MGLLTVRVGVFLMLLPALGTFLLLLGCPVQPWNKGLCLVLLYLTVLGCYLWKTCSILKGNEGEVNLGEREEGKGNWEQWREGQLWSESIVLKNIYVYLQHVPNFIASLNHGSQTQTQMFSAL